MLYTFCHVSHIQQDLQADMDDEHDILLDQSNEVDSFLPTSVSALELTIHILSYHCLAGISQTFSTIQATRTPSCDTETRLGPCH